MIHCNGEPGTFPEDEFLMKNGRVLAPIVHANNVLTPHYASTGLPVLHPTDTPSIESLESPLRELIRKQVEHVSDVETNIAAPHE